MSDGFLFETFVDVHINILEEYLSSVIAKLSKEYENYKALQAEIESMYQQYPKALGVFDTEQAVNLMPLFFQFLFLVKNHVLS